MVQAPRPGDRVLVETALRSYEGVFLPAEEDSLFVVKLDSGYNVGIPRAEAKSCKVLGKAAPVSAPAPKRSRSAKGLPRISVLHTGGTIASKVDYATGGVSAHFSSEGLLELFPELASLASVESRMVRQMMSENMRFSHYNVLAREVEKEIRKGVDGVIIAQGTDTLHYSSAALAFALEDLPVPVIFVGAQRSSDRGSSDAAVNMIAAVRFIVSQAFAEVAVCMHEKSDDDACIIIPGCKVRKMHTSRRDAFRPVNALPYARVTADGVEVIDGSFRKGGGKLKLRLFKDDLKVGLLKSHVNMFAEQFLAFEGFDGLVLEGTGLGQLPNTEVDNETAESGRIFEALRKLTRKMPVVMSSQCIYGRVDMQVYAEGRRNIAAGVLGNYHDMTPETAFIKLAWLLSNFDRKEISSLLLEDFRGEIRERIGEDEFLV